MSDLLPYGQMEIRVYKEFCGTKKERCVGYSNLRIKKKYGETITKYNAVLEKEEEYPLYYFLGVVGIGETAKEAFEKTIENFIEVFYSEYNDERRPLGLEYEDIEHVDVNEY